MNVCFVQELWWCIVLFWCIDDAHHLSAVSLLLLRMRVFLSRSYFYGFASSFSLFFMKSV